MSMSISTNNDPSSASASAKVQIQALEKDPNATAAYKQQLENWLQQLNAAGSGGAGASAPGQGAPAAGQPPAGPQSPASPSAPGAAPSSAAPTGQDASASPAPDSASPSGAGKDVLSGSNVPAALKALAPQIEAASKKTGVPVDELAAEIWDESRGKAGATSTNPGNGGTDSGLMQINPSTYADLQSKHPELQGKSLSDPGTNILAGATLLADYKKQFGSMDAAQIAFNSGPGAVDVHNPGVAKGGGADPNYNNKVDNIRKELDSGQAPPA